MCTLQWQGLRVGSNADKSKAYTGMYAQCNSVLPLNRHDASSADQQVSRYLATEKDVHPNVPARKALHTDGDGCTSTT